MYILCKYIYIMYIYIWSRPAARSPMGWVQE
jgi:hypothetical protein